jgi:rod shape-determining protein MreC
MDINNTQSSIIYNLSQDTAMKAGDEIRTSGVGYIYPKDLRIGKVTSIQDDKATISKQAI